MVRRKLVGLLLCSLVMVLANTSWAGIPDLDYCDAVSAYANQVAVYNLPNGNGKPLTEARYSSGVGNTTVVNATITLTVRDTNQDPIFLYPSEDMWLEGTLGGLKLCPGGSVADFSTNANGVTTFSVPKLAGGQTNPAGGERTVVMISGSPMNSDLLNIQWNSPDINGDLIVNLTDTVFYAGDATGGVYKFRSDFLYDNRLNLSDTVLYAQGIGAACP